MYHIYGDSQAMIQGDPYFEVYPKNYQNEMLNNNNNNNNNNITFVGFGSQEC